MKKVLALVSSLLLVATLATPAQSAGAQFSVYQKTLATFSSSATGLTSQQKAQVKAAVEANPAAEKFICTGIRYYDQPMSANITVRKRAKAACDYAKQLNPALSTWFQNKPTQARSFAGKVLLTVKTSIQAPLPETALEGQAEQCRLVDQRQQLRQPNNVGFPLQSDTVPTSGVANMAVVPVSFTDAAPEPELLAWAKEQTEKMVDWYDFSSQGKLTFNVQYPQNWVELSVPASDFSSAKGVANVAPTEADRLRNANQAELTQKVITGLGTSINFTDLHVVIFIFPRSATAITTSILQRGVTVETPAGRQRVLSWGTGADHFSYPDLEWALMAHEILHSQGLALHAPGNGSDFGIGQNQYARSALLSGWEQFRLGWLDDSQVACVDAGSLSSASSVVNLHPLEITSGEKKLLIVRLSASKAIVVESRRPVGYSKDFKGLSGLVMYEVDVTLDNDRASESSGDPGNSRDFDKWGYLLAPTGTSRPDSSGGSEKFVFSKGESTVQGGVIIKLIHSGDVDSVELTID